MWIEVKYVSFVSNFWSKTLWHQMQMQVQEEMKMTKWQTCGHICTFTFFFTQLHDNLENTLALSYAYTFSIHLHLHIYITHSQLLTFCVHHFCATTNSHVKCTLQSCSTNIIYTPTHYDAQTLLTFMCDLVNFMTRSFLHLVHQLVNFLLQCKYWNLAKEKWLKKWNLSAITQSNEFDHQIYKVCNPHSLCFVGLEVFAMTWRINNQENTSSMTNQSNESCLAYMM